MNRSPLQIITGATCALALTFALGGCGKDDDPQATSSGTPVDPAVAKFVEAAQAICVESRKSIAVIQADAAPKPTAAELKALLIRLSDVLVAETDQLKKLAAPAPIASNVNDWLTSLTKAAVKTKDQTEESIREATESGKESIFADADARAAAVGVPACRTDYVPAG